MSPKSEDRVRARFMVLDGVGGAHSGVDGVEVASVEVELEPELDVDVDRLAEEVERESEFRVRLPRTMAVGCGVEDVVKGGRTMGQIASSLHHNTFQPPPKPFPTTFCLLACFLPTRLRQSRDTHCLKIG